MDMAGADIASKAVVAGGSMAVQMVADTTAGIVTLPMAHMEQVLRQPVLQERVRMQRQHTLTHRQRGPMHRRPTRMRRQHVQISSNRNNTRRSNTRAMVVAVNRAVAVVVDAAVVEAADVGKNFDVEMRKRRSEMLCRFCFGQYLGAS